MFKFRLQRLLELREQRERQVAIRLNEAQSQVDALLREQERLEALRSGSMLPGRRGAPATVGQYQNARYLAERLNEAVQRTQRDAEAAAEDVQQRMQEFTVAMQERRVLDRMRERLLEGWRATRAQVDLQAMDGIALSRFVRARAADETRDAQDEDEEETP